MKTTRDHKAGGSSRRPLVLGLAGGIGAGKSAAARILEDLGCRVLDADTRAKALLDRPDIANELRSWWGDDIFGDEGRIRRDAVASIIFSDEAERRRLQDLIHPEVVAEQREAINEAARAGERCVVIDAPLLFEAGADALCDAVIFLDAPREQRLARLRESRGWDEAELERREKSQLPLEKKRRKAEYVVQNDADLDLLRERIRDVLSGIMPVD